MVSTKLLSKLYLIKLFALLISMRLCLQECPLLVRATKSPATLPLTNPEELAMLNGVVRTNSYHDTWYVPHKFYMLTKVKMWKNA